MAHCPRIPPPRLRGRGSATRRRGPTQPGDLSLPGRGLARDRRGMNGPCLAEVPALPDGAAAGEAPAQALPFPARERSAGASSAPGSPKAPFPVSAPVPRLRLEPRRRSPTRLPSLHPAPSAIPPRGPQHERFSFSPEDRSVSPCARGIPRAGQEAAGVAQARRAAQEVRLQSPAAARRVTSTPLPLLEGGCVRSIPGTQREQPALFSRPVCRRGAPAAGGAAPAPLAFSRTFLSGKSLPVHLGGAEHGGKLGLGCSATPRGRTPPGASSLLSPGSLHLQLPENKCPPHGVTHLL